MERYKGGKENKENRGRMADGDRRVDGKDINNKGRAREEEEK